METSAITDEELLRGVRDGDSVLFEQLVDRYSEPLLRYIQRFTVASESAEDLLQEVFIRVYHNAERFDFRRKFKPWIYKIATNLCRDFLRTRKETVSLDYHYAPSGNSLLSILPAREKNPDEQYSDLELIEELHSAIGELPVPQKQVFLLFHFQKVSQEEIGKMMQIPVGTVKSRLFHAYKKVFLSMKTRANEWPEKLPILLILICF